MRGISAVRQETEMGIAIQELLSQEYFKDFYVLAGAKGLHREIQGITVSLDKREGTGTFIRVRYCKGTRLY